MHKSVLAAAVPFCVVGPTAGAQQAAVPEDSRDERPHIQVLRDPYDLASFYRSGGRPQGSGFTPAYDFVEAGIPPGWFGRDLRGRYFGPHWISGFGASFEITRASGYWGRRSPWGRGWGFRDSGRDDRRPRPAPRP